MQVDTSILSQLILFFCSIKTYIDEYPLQVRFVQLALREEKRKIEMNFNYVMSLFLAQILISFYSKNTLINSFQVVTFSVQIPLFIFFLSIFWFSKCTIHININNIQLAKRKIHANTSYVKMKYYNTETKSTTSITVNLIENLNANLLGMVFSCF